MKNVKTVDKDCYACGICSIVCPKSCINFSFDDKKGRFAVSVSDSLCIECGKCLKVCPVLSSDKVYEGKSALGITKNAYAAYSKDEEVRKHAASGGFITSFLCYLLDSGKCDGVLLSQRKGITGQSFIAKSSTEVLSSKSSIYAPVDYANGVRMLLNTDCKRLAVVGLPCQIQALENLEKINRRVADKITLKVSIVCGKTPTTHAYKYIAKQIGFNYNSIKSVVNRGEGWPGYLKIAHSEGVYKTPYRSSLSMGMVLSSPYLCNRGCLSCVDGVGLTVDLVVCDAWTSKYTGSKSDGWNFVLTKTALAESIFQEKGFDKYIYAEPESIDNFYKANKRVINKGAIGNMMRAEGHRIHNSYSPSLKYRAHIVLLKLTTRFFNPINISKAQLLIGKIINKLKD